MLVLSPDKSQVHVATTASPVTLQPGRKLPHLRKAGAVYIVTFRLADSLPQSVVDSWRRERDEILAVSQQMKRALTGAELSRLRQLFTEKIDGFLDSGAGNCWLCDHGVAEIVRDALKFHHMERYLILNWVIMPNHVHGILWPLPGHELNDILHDLKKFTSPRINRYLVRKGTFWQLESYDHLVRDDADLWHGIRYLAANPIRANLVDWPWQERGLVADGDGIWVASCSLADELADGVRQWQEALQEMEGSWY